MAAVDGSALGGGAIAAGIDACEGVNVLLLYGPPGCGKTARAQEIATALKVRAPKIVSVSSPSNLFGRCNDLDFIVAFALAVSIGSANLLLMMLHWFSND